MKTWKVEKEYVSNSIVVCSCGIRKSINNKKLKDYTCSCVSKLNFTGSLRTLYREYRYSAINRGLSFTISFPHFEYLTNLDCFYCGIPSC